MVTAVCMFLSVMMLGLSIIAPSTGAAEEEAAMCNPYAFYGQPQLWPRGYPLDRIKNEPECRGFRRVHSQPIILQVWRTPSPFFC